MYDANGDRIKSPFLRAFYLIILIGSFILAMLIAGMIAGGLADRYPTVSKWIMPIIEFVGSLRFADCIMAAVIYVLYLTVENFERILLEYKQRRDEDIDELERIITELNQRTVETNDEVLKLAQRILKIRETDI